MDETNKRIGSDERTTRMANDEGFLPLCPTRDVCSERGAMALSGGAASDDGGIAAASLCEAAAAKPSVGPSQMLGALVSLPFSPPVRSKHSGKFHRQACGLFIIQCPLFVSKLVLAFIKRKN